MCNFWLLVFMFTFAFCIEFFGIKGWSILFMSWFFFGKLPKTNYKYFTKRYILFWFHFVFWYWKLIFLAYTQIALLQENQRNLDVSIFQNVLYIYTTFCNTLKLIHFSKQNNYWTIIQNVVKIIQPIINTNIPTYIIECFQVKCIW